MNTATFVLIVFLHTGGVQQVDLSSSYANCTRNKHSYTEAYRKNSQPIPKMECVELTHTK